MPATKRRKSKTRNAINEICAKCAMFEKCYDFKEGGKKVTTCAAFKILGRNKEVMRLVEAVVDLEALAYEGINHLSLDNRPRISGPNAFHSEPPKYESSIQKMIKEIRKDCDAMRRRILRRIGMIQLERFGCDFESECLGCPAWTKNRCLFGRV